MTMPSQPPQPMRIFIVENHPDTLQSFIFYLESEGHTVDSASSIAEALDAIPASGCEVVFSDIGLPDGTGWDLLAQLKTAHPIFAVAMSGFGMNADRSKSLAAGFRHHLIKPVTPDQIDAILQEAETFLGPRT